MKIGFLYSGQGSQQVGMGLDFYNNIDSAKKFYDTNIYSEDLKRLSFESSENIISNTENTQLILVGFQIMLTKLFKEKGILPSSVCGLSIGEYAALYSSNVLSDEDAIKIAKFRGDIMSKCCENIETSMYAVMISDEDALKDILNKYNRVIDFVEISNINTNKQMVISGSNIIMGKVLEELNEQKIKAIKLKVSGPFHTKYMNLASEKLKEYFENIEFREPNIELYLNLTGDIVNKDNDIKEIMSKQVNNTVRFCEDIQSMIKNGTDIFIEIGSNKIIKNMVKKIDKNVIVYSVGTYEDFEEVVRSING